MSKLFFKRIFFFLIGCNLGGFYFFFVGSKFKILKKNFYFSNVVDFVNSVIFFVGWFNFDIE